MSETLCHHLGLAYDPDTNLEMVAANGSINQSLGLARNVPVKFGEIVVYLQIHVFHSPAYDVLLGRPFDVLTESIVKTSRDGTQSITLNDPNSGTKAVLLTHARGHAEFPPSTAKPPEPQGFRSSRI